MVTRLGTKKTAARDPWLRHAASVAERGFSSPFVQCVLAAFVIAAVTYASTSFRWSLAFAICLYIAVVVALAFTANIFVAVGAAIAAALSMDYFLTEPRLSFAMANPIETVALILFVGIALSTATLASRLKARTYELELANTKLAKHSEMMLEQAQEFARVNRVMLMGEMTASIAHEINQPLTGIIYTPILMLSTRDGVEDRVAGLQNGADDYLVKPFVEAELLARIDALARRAERPFMPALELGRLHIDLAARAARYDTAELDLSAKEFRLLELLARNAGRTFSRSALLERVWGYDFDGVSNVVDVYVSHLRKKLRHAGSAEQMIQTAWGVGYKLQAS